MDFDFDSEDSSSTQSFFDRLHSDSTPRNLSQIFEEDLRPLRNESLSLRYQPRVKKQQPLPASSSLRTDSSQNGSSLGSPREASRWDVAFAKVAQVYQGTETGPMGLAVTIRGANDEANLIVYKQKTQVITSLRLMPNGGTVHMRESYVQFYDDTRHFWSMRFVHEADEHLFVRTMIDNSLPIELHSARSAGDGSVEQQQQQQARADQGKGNRDACKKHREQTETTEPHREHIDHKGHCREHKEPRKCACDNSVRHRHHRDLNETQAAAPQPQPKPRLRSLAAHMEHRPDSEEPERKPTYMESLRIHFMNIGCGVEHKRDPDRDQIPEEDVIVTPMPRPIGTTTKEEITIKDTATPPSQLALASTAENQSSASLLTKFLDDQGATGLEKMECILDVMQRMSMAQSKGSVDEGTKHKPTTSTATTMSTTSDSEDKLLELELALLKLKKENRTLVRSLKKREEELFEFQSSSATLLERLLLKNNELKQRNSILLETVTGKIIGGQAAAGNNNNERQSSCVNCDRSAQEIEFLKYHISALKVAMGDPDL